MIPLSKGALSHGLMERMDEVIKDYDHRAAKFVAAMREITEVIEQGNWALAELLYWFDFHKIWSEAGYTDDEGVERKYTSFREFIRIGKTVKIGPAWAYILKGVYETFILDLKINSEKPDLLTKLLNVGSFEKLYLTRKIVTHENVGYWLDVAAVMERDELARAVDKSLLEESNTSACRPVLELSPSGGVHPDSL